MEDYIKEWEEYVASNYNPKEMTRCKLDELYKISDIMKDMAEYWKIKMEMGV